MICSTNTPSVSAMHDILFHVIFGSDRESIQEFLNASAARLQCIVKCKHLEGTMQCALSKDNPVPLQTLKAMFFLFLNVDMVLKDYVCNTASKPAFAAAMNVKQSTKGLENLHAWSMVGTRPLNHGKAINFFIALHDNVVKKWLQDERKSAAEFVEAVKDAYLVS